MIHLHWVLAAACIITFAVFGYFKGVVQQIFGIIGLGLAIILAPRITNLLYQLGLETLHRQRILEDPARPVVVLICGSLIYMLVMTEAAIVHKRHVGKHKVRRAFDRLGGLIGGAIKGVIVFAIVTQMLSKWAV